MLQYLVIQLDDTSVSYCHYENKKTIHNLISIEDLKSGILYAMKENLMIQFLYPDYELTKDYKDVIDTISHYNIVPSVCEDKSLLENADVVVFHDWMKLELFNFTGQSACVLRTSKDELFEKYSQLGKILNIVPRLNIVITDIDTFKGADYKKNKKVLSYLSEEIERMYLDRKSPQLNLLTDRMMLNSMNNCNAGFENITLAPDGKFYVCPAFYLAEDSEDYGLGKAKYNIGDLRKGVDIKNPQLYKLSHAPLCNHCDAYQCKRCVWLNRKMTYELNTPSHEQCVIAHIERNASRDLLYRIRKYGTFLPEQEIKEIDYLDPLDIKDEW